MAKVFYLENIKKGLFKDTIVVIGYFDGVHVGHQKIISLCVERARELGGSSLVFTFDRPPVNIIRRGLYKKLITSLEDKIELIENMGVDYIVLARFDEEFSRLTPESFCREVLLEKLGPKEVFVGEGFRFGRDAEGDNVFLGNFLSSYGVVLTTVPLYRVNGIIVSSTAVREYFSKGDIEKVKKLLGRYPRISGRVVKASGRGKKLGFPTANIDVSDRFVIPRDGVYTGIVMIEDQKERFFCVVNVGNNPTFGGTKKWVEAHVLDFDRDMYGKKISIYFLKRIRDEIVFRDESELVKQIKTDLSTARKYFSDEFSEEYIHSL